MKKEKLIVSWDEIIPLCKQLSKKIRESEFKPDVLVGMIRGGLIPVRILSTELKCNDVYCLRAKYCRKGNKRTREVRIILGLNVDLTGKKILLVDEIADSGETLKLIKDYLAFFNPKEIKTAVIHFKHSSIIVPDYFVEKAEKWVQYPWE
ncbi:MAG: phosphoribosyltransferase [Candidatus Diapherotrites archaeon]